ncbi:MAG: phosphatase PAP2 family protein [Burkholderiales bacterium]|nr:phosphatase PAP2 family protein [Burkholderiales bacterium]
MNFVDDFRMPPPLTVLGVMYGIFALANIILFLKDGYWSGVLTGIFSILKCNIKYILFSIFLILLIIMFIDKPLSNLCRTFYNIKVYTATDFINSMGEGWFICGALFTIALVLSSLNYINHAIAFRVAFMTSILAGLVNSVFKFIFNRERPVIGNDEWHFFHFFVTGAKNPADLMYAYNSMPSGHTITLAASLTVLFCYSHSKIARVIMIFLAVLIAYARVYTLNHWASDVVVSGLMGIVIGYVSYNTNKKRFIQ